MEDKTTLFVILNITHFDFGGKFYGRIYLCSNPDVTFQNIRDFAVNKLGVHVDLTRNLSFEEAQLLDKNTYYIYYAAAWNNGERETIRFDSIKQITDAGIKKYHEMALDVPFISLFDGLKLRGTVTLNENEKYHRPMVYFDVKAFWMQELDPASPMFDQVYHDQMVWEHGSIEKYFQSEEMVTNIEKAREMPYPETDEYPCIPLQAKPRGVVPGKKY